MSPAKSSHQFLKRFFCKIYFKFDEKYNGKLYASILISGILGAQPMCTVPRLTNGRCLLLCVAAMLEAACEILSRLYCLKFIAVALYLCDK